MVKFTAKNFANQPQAQENHSNVKQNPWSKLVEEQPHDRHGNFTVQPTGQQELRRQMTKQIGFTRFLYCQYMERRWPHAFQYF